MRYLKIAAVLLLTCLISSFADEPQKEHPEVGLARLKFEQEISAALKPVEKRYLAKLEALQKDLARKKDVAGALAVKAAMNTFKSKPLSSQLTSTLEGTWMVKYSNGVVRTYIITEDGVVKFVEGEMTGKLVWNQGAWQIEFSDGKLERISMKRMLDIEHYTSRIEFDLDKPSFSAIGTRKE
jgi:hypothetical protein